MSVKLISLTQPMIESLKTAEDLIVYCARVSNPDNQLNLDTGSKLIKYCIEHQHWSVMEQASMTVEIRTSRAIAAQILRHRSFVFQEFSQRYSEVTEMAIPVLGRAQGKKNRQVGDERLPDDSQVMWQLLQNSVYQVAQDHYERALKLGVAREQARLLLPLATPTTLYMSGNVRSWIHYLQSRCAVETQKEHRDLAITIKKIFVKEFPVIADALLWIEGGNGNESDN